ncbi:MAG: segregation/condensation protein A [Clostridiales bacterium]|jgi:segregation and condensation protein A|nr:segregation/condensation protein A [Clostridiales bacterium]
MDLMEFKTQAFEGPIELLMSLVQKNKVDIYDIPIAVITRQYLEYLEHMEKMDLEVSSDFLVMAAQLLLIKSKMLLPKNDNEDADEDPREELVRLLQEYQIFKQAAEVVGVRQTAGDNIFFKEPSYIEPAVHDFTFKDLDIERLQDALANILERKDFLAKPSKQEFAHIMGRQKVTIISKMRELLNALECGAQVEFEEFFESMDSRMEIVAGFLAVLELLRLNKIEINRGKLVKREEYTTVAG